MSLKHVMADAAGHDDHGLKIRIGDSVRGALIVLVGAVVLVGISFGVMMALTSPDGWLAKAAGNVIRGETAQAQVTSYGGAEPVNSQQPF